MTILEDLRASKEQNLLRWNLTAAEIATLANEIIEQGRAEYDLIATSKEAPTYENTLKLMADADSFSDVVSSCCTFPKNASSSKEARDAATEASKALSKFNVECSMRYDVYAAMKAYANTQPALEGEDKRLLDRIMRDYRRVGMELPEDQRNEVKTIKERLSELGTNYSKNSNEENSTLTFSQKELAGMPDDWLSARRLKGEDGKETDDQAYTVSLKYPDFFPLMKMCVVASTRQKMEYAFNSRNLPENVNIMEELVELRQKQASLLGFKTHAHNILDVRMAKSPDTVLPFLEDLNTKLTPLWEKEVQVLLRYKQEECKDLGQDYDGKLNAWDLAHYMYLVEQKDYQVDHETIKAYFPLAHVTTELLAIYQELLGLVFKEVENPQVWHEEVRLFEVFNSETFNKRPEATAYQSGSEKLIGMFYLDMHPRDGKYGHAAVWGLQPGCLNAAGARQIPVAAGLMNFSKGSGDKPSMLTHNEVVTFFHEFGHAMHQICSLAKFSQFAGTAVERDFVEAPSQMLENWCWCKEGIARLSSHFQTGEKLPKALVDKLVASKVASAGYKNKRQLVFGMFDQMIHSRAQADTAKVFVEVGQKVFPELPATPGTNKAGSFGHLAGGYDAQYYGYMWSDVFSIDMFESRFQKEGVFNPDTGADYRRCILRPGGSRDAADMLRDFLGRDPQPEPFLRSIGL